MDASARSLGTSSNRRTQKKRSSSNADETAAAAASLQLLLREDPLLTEYQLTVTESSTGDQPNPNAVAYAAALLLSNNSTDVATHSVVATEACQDVERKLALVESLAVKLSRTSPEAVAGPLLRLHGHSGVLLDQEVPDDAEEQDRITESSTPTTTLPVLRDRAARLERQAQSLESVAVRVERSLTKGLDRLDLACTQLDRVLQLSTTIKQIALWQFELEKLQQSLDLLDDPRELVRAAASVSVLEESLLKQDDANSNIHLLQQLRPQAQRAATAVRHAVEALWPPTTLPQLGASLQVAYQLHELPKTVFRLLDDAHRGAMVASNELWCGNTLQNLTDLAKQNPNLSLDTLRAQAAREWATAVQAAAKPVWELHKVLHSQTDPVRRIGYWQVLVSEVVGKEIGVPEEYRLEGFDHSKQLPPLPRLFWTRVGRSVKEVISSLLSHDKWVERAAALYPAVHSAALQILPSVLLLSASSSTALVIDDPSAASRGGILGGTSSLFLSSPMEEQVFEENPQSASSTSSVSATQWTQPQGGAAAAPSDPNVASAQRSTTTATAAILACPEWHSLHDTGLAPLQKAFLNACRDRLHAPVQYMFPEQSVVLPEDDMNAGAAPLLPSKYDLQRFDETIRSELALDPGVAIIAVEVLDEFLARAKAVLRGGRYLSDNWQITDALQHDRKVVAMVYTLHKYVSQAPEQVFGKSDMMTMRQCRAALAPALEHIDSMVQTTSLGPVIRTLTQQLDASVLSKIHQGVYATAATGGVDDHASSSGFISTYVVPAFEAIGANILPKFPPPYASRIAAAVATFFLYGYSSNVCLLRPLTEPTRMQLTEDLANLELTVERFVTNSCNNITTSAPLASLDHGRPYAELRALRPLLFWSGLQSRTTAPKDVTAALLHDANLTALRSTTLAHYLLSAYGPQLLSSPHQLQTHQNILANEYVTTRLLTWLGALRDEKPAWQLLQQCCDAYQQRASAVSTTDGDSRVAAVLLALREEYHRSHH